MNKNRIRSLAQEGNKKAKVIEKLFDDSTKFLSTNSDSYYQFAGFYSPASAAAGISPVLAEWMMGIQHPVQPADRAQRSDACSDVFQPGIRRACA